jgi:hypothetical protein
MLRRTHPNHFTTIHTDYAKEQTPWIPAQPMVEEAHAPSRSHTEPIRVVRMAPPKHSKYQRG